MIHLQNLNSVKQETTHGGDTVVENEVITDSQDMEVMGDEDSVDDPEIDEYGIALEFGDDDVELSEHVSSFAQELSPSQ